MTKSNKNIIAIVVLVVMIICLFFTVKYMKDNDRGINFNNIDTQVLKDRPTSSRGNKSNDTIESKKQTESEETTEDSNSKTTQRRQRPSNMPDRKDFDFNNIEKPNQKNKSNDLLLVLYGLESAVIGATILFVIMNNVKTKKK